MSTEIDVTVPATTTNMEVDVAIDVSTVKSILLMSDKALTLKTNSTGSPDLTLALKANIPYVWNTDSYDALKTAIDITKLYLTNAGGASAAFKLRCVSDPTP